MVKINYRPPGGYFKGNIWRYLEGEKYII